MAVLAVVTSSPESVEGGHLVIARSLVAAAREAGHDAHLVLTPDCQFGRQASAYVETWRTDVTRAAGRPVDQVISLRYPSYAVRHPRHVCWLNHTMREYYDLWPRFSGSLSARARLKETAKRVGDSSGRSLAADPQRHGGRRAVADDRAPPAGGSRRQGGRAAAAAAAAAVSVRRLRRLHLRRLAPHAAEAAGSVDSRAGAAGGRRDPRRDRRRRREPRARSNS